MGQRTKPRKCAKNNWKGLWWIFRILKMCLMLEAWKLSMLIDLKCTRTHEWHAIAQCYSNWCVWRFASAPSHCLAHLFYWHNSYSFGRKLQALSAHISVIGKVRFMRSRLSFKCSYSYELFDMRRSWIHVVYLRYEPRSDVWNIACESRHSVCALAFYLNFICSLVMRKSSGNETTIAWMGKGANSPKINTDTGNLKCFYFLFIAFIRRNSLLWRTILGRRIQNASRVAVHFLNKLEIFHHISTPSLSYSSMPLLIFVALASEMAADVMFLRKDMWIKHHGNWMKLKWVLDKKKREKIFTSAKNTMD